VRKTGTFLGAGWALFERDLSHSNIFEFVLKLRWFLYGFVDMNAIAIVLL